MDHVLFTYDQARDLFMGESIRNGDFKLVGPPTDIPTLFHGPLYYYFLALFNRPESAFPAVIFLNLLSCIPLYLLAFSLFRSKFWAFMPVILFLVSFEMVSYARWLSNPAFVVPSMAIWLLGLRLKNLPLTALGLGLCIQFQFFMLYLLPLTIIYLIKSPKKHLFKSLFLFFVLMSSFLAAEIKFNFQGVLGLINFFSRENTGNFDLINRFRHYFESLQNLFVNNLFPSYPITALSLAVFIALVNIFLHKKSREPAVFSLFLLAGHFLVFLFSDTMHIFIGVGMGFAVILLVANGIYILNKKSAILAGAMLMTVVFGNLYAIFQSKESLFKVQPGMILRNETALVSKTYEIAAGRQFSLNAVTNPYLYPTLWAYHYRKNPPFYRGLTAYTFAGQGVFIQNDQKQDLEFLIIEPEVGAAQSWANQLIDAEKRRHDLKQEYNFGKFTLLEF